MKMLQSSLLDFTFPRVSVFNKITPSIERVVVFGTIGFSSNKQLTDKHPNSKTFIYVLLILPNRNLSQHMPRTIALVFCILVPCRLLNTNPKQLPNENLSITIIAGPTRRKILLILRK